MNTLITNSHYRVSQYITSPRSQSARPRALVVRERRRLLQGPTVVSGSGLVRFLCAWLPGSVSTVAGLGMAGFSVVVVVAVCGPCGSAAAMSVAGEGLLHATGSGHLRTLFRATLIGGERGLSMRRSSAPLGYSCMTRYGPLYGRASLYAGPVFRAGMKANTRSPTLNSAFLAVLS